MVHSGLEFRPIERLSPGVDDNSAPLYRAFVTLNLGSDSTATWHRANAITLQSRPPYPEFDTGDLFTPHPDPAKAHYMWKFAGRADDLLTFATGNNLYRAGIEKEFTNHELVRSALIAGTGHRQALLLLELADGVSNDMAARLWDEAVAPLNEKLPLRGCIAMTHILLVPCGEFERTPKGSVVRRVTEEKFANEIEAVYAEFGDEPPLAR